MHSFIITFFSFSISSASFSCRFLFSPYYKSYSLTFLRYLLIIDLQVLISSFATAPLFLHSPSSFLSSPAPIYLTPTLKVITFHLCMPCNTDPLRYLSPSSSHSLLITPLTRILYRLLSLFCLYLTLLQPYLWHSLPSSTYSHFSSFHFISVFKQYVLSSSLHSNFLTRLLFSLFMLKYVNPRIPANAAPQSPLRPKAYAFSKHAFSRAFLLFSMTETCGELQPQSVEMCGDRGSESVHTGLRDNLGHLGYPKICRLQRQKEAIRIRKKLKWSRWHKLS